MTDDTPPIIELDIQIEEQTTGELFVWRGCRDTGKGDGYVDVWVHARQTEVAEGRQVFLVGELLLKGRVAASGLAELTFEPVAWRALIEWQRHMQVLGNLYVRAFELLGVAPPASDQHGRAAFASAMADRELRRARDSQGVRTIGLVEA